MTVTRLRFVLLCANRLISGDCLVLCSHLALLCDDNGVRVTTEARYLLLEGPNKRSRISGDSNASRSLTLLAQSTSLDLALLPLDESVTHERILSSRRVVEENILFTTLFPAKPSTATSHFWSPLSQLRLDVFLPQHDSLTPHRQISLYDSRLKPFHHFINLWIMIPQRRFRIYVFSLITTHTLEFSWCLFRKLGRKKGKKRRTSSPVTSQYFF